MSRNEQRWRLLGAGLSNVWRFGDLELSATSGRLLLRGPNGTGKTTALEALVPYLLDLNPARMSAGKARTTNLSSLMREGATGKRRIGYAWLTLSQKTESVWSFGVRIQYSESASPPVAVVPFALPGRPLHELQLYGPGRAPLSPEQFSHAITGCGGQVFADEKDYVVHVAARLFGTPNRDEVATTAQRLRQVRNPALLADVSPQSAADALRESLPGVSEDVIAATADALAESDATREAFTRDTEAAQVLDEFRDVWCAHAIDVLATLHAAATEAAREVRGQAIRTRARSTDLANASAEAEQAADRVRALSADISKTKSEMDALEKHHAYQDAGRLADLKTMASAQSAAALTAVHLMQQNAEASVRESDSLERELHNVQEDIQTCRRQAQGADRSADDGSPLLSWARRARPHLRAGTVVVNAGHELLISGDATTLQKAASVWTGIADAHTTRSEAASLALTDYKDAAALREIADRHARVANDLATKADAQSTAAKSAEIQARDSARVLLAAIRDWVSKNLRLTEPLAAAGDGTDHSSSWTVEDIEHLLPNEPAFVLEQCDAWARHAVARAEELAADLRRTAKHALTEAVGARLAASRLRMEADDLRSGRLLPFPRPEWAPPCDDDVALGVTIDWHTGFDDPRRRALVEGATAAAGLLGAAVAESGVNTRFWRVEPNGPVVVPNLLDVIAVDEGHSLSSAASSILARVRLMETADGIEQSESICIGRDGTFCAGVLRGRIPGADDAALLMPATHVGARQRRAAAIARAEVLEREATELEENAAGQEHVAAALNQDANEISVLGRTVPSRESLRAAETRRVELSRLAADAQVAARAAQEQCERSESNFQRAHGEWIGRTSRLGLPTEIADLAALRDRSREAAERLREAAHVLGTKLADRLSRVLNSYLPTAISARLHQTEAAAQEACRQAGDTATAIDILEQTAGAAIADVLARHDAARSRLSHLQNEFGPADKLKTEKAKEESKAQEQFDESERRLREELEPRAKRELEALRSLLDVPGVAASVLDDEPASQDDTLLEQVATKLRGRRRLTVKTVLERVDTVKAKLAGIWSLDPGDTYGQLLTFVLTYRDATYTPIDAAQYAQTLKKRAEQALAGSEERALREFVIGRMPTALGTAWTRLQDWVDEVNRKMRSAAASSGVGVQVRIPLRSDLAPACREVYQLSCTVSAAERTSDQERRLGDALQALLAAAQGETMHQRVSAAVDIRDWVEVHYEVTRSGGTKQRWTSRTGLSGGERRLVVLAPMLAAIAAGFDRLGQDVFRLVALDEIPAEVDERGREGLARYIAELDLDLVCTSYLWDGCPGAWDGIDAYDLEAGSDGTVVGFPMLVRGMSEADVASVGSARLLQ
jgi:hypothetical protein